MYGLDPLYFLFTIPGVLISAWASRRVKRTFLEYAKHPTRGGLSGADAARLVLQKGGVPEVRVEEVGGFLSDHYDPVKRVLRLSPDNYRGASISAIGVACHEAGHALQHKAGYAPMWMRSALVPIASLGSRAWMLVLMAGALLGFMGLVKVGILLFAATVVFQLVTLPVEFDATRRAKLVMADHGILAADEQVGAAKVLDAAAWTYIAAALAAILQLAYFLIRFGMVGRRND